MKKITPLICFGLVSTLLSLGQRINWQWAKGTGGVGVQEGALIAADTSGNVFISGFYQSRSIVFDSVNLSTNANENQFIAKYTTAGNFVWARQPSVDNSLLGSEAEVFDPERKLMYRAEVKTLNSDISFNAVRGIYTLKISLQQAILLRKVVKL